MNPRLPSKKECDAASAGASIKDCCPDQSLPLAIFDLDGTLTTRDTLMPFLYSFGRRHRKWFAMIATPFFLALYALRIISARSAKERALSVFLRGTRVSVIQGHAHWFCEHWLSGHLRADMTDQLARHQSEGTRVVLLSASPDVYVDRIAQKLGIEEVVCTRVRFDGDVCTGRLDGENCKGEEKLRRIKLYLNRDAPPVGSYAYGDSNSDQPVLNWVDHGVKC